MNWADEDKARDKKLWKDGLSASQIAAEMNVTRNMICGVVARMGLSRTDRKRKPAISVSAKPRKKRKPHFGAWRMSTAATAIKPEPFKPKACDVVPLNIKLIDLISGQCRYPYGDGPYLFCGHPVQDGKSYCPGHCALVYTAPRERNALAKRLKPRRYKASGQDKAADAREWLEEAA